MADDSVYQLMLRAAQRNPLLQQLQRTSANTIPSVRIREQSKVRARRHHLKKTATTQEKKLQVKSGLNSLIPVCYGLNLRAVQIFAVGTIGTDLVLGGWFALGEIESIVKVRCNDDNVPAGITITEYTGTTTQGVDSTLASAISGYADDLVLSVGGSQIGVAYIVARIPKNEVNGFPRFTVEFKGLKNIYDPRDSSTAYSDNPALCFRDWLTSSVYGPGFSVLDSTFETAADFCDDVVGGTTWQPLYDYSVGDFVVPTTGNTLNRIYECTADAGTSGAGEPTWNTTIGGTTADDGITWTCRDGRRHVCGMSMERKASVTSWIETWRTACGCLVNYGESGIEVVPDTTRATDHVIEHSSGQITELPQISLQHEGLENVPTVVRVNYTNTTGIPWRTGSDARVALSGVDSGTVALRESVIDAPWIQRKSEAVRVATERLNAANTTTLGVRFGLFDEGLEVKAGDIIELTHPVGLTSKQFRVLDNSQDDIGRWIVTAFEYDASVYSSHIEVEPTYSDLEYNSGVAPHWSAVYDDDGNRPEDSADVTGNHAADINVLLTQNAPAEANADVTGSHTANNTTYVNDSVTQSSYVYNVDGDLHMRYGTDISFYDSSSNYRGGIYGDSGGVTLSASGSLVLHGTSGGNVGTATYYFTSGYINYIYGTEVDVTTYKAGGTSGVTWGPGSPTSITVKGGIVTAIS